MSKVFDDPDYMRFYALVFSFILIFTPVYSYAFVPILFQAGRAGLVLQKGGKFLKVNSGKDVLKWAFGGVGTYCLANPSFCYDVFKDTKDKIFSDDKYSGLQFITNQGGGTNIFNTPVDMCKHYMNNVYGNTVSVNLTKHEARPNGGVNYKVGDFVSCFGEIKTKTFTTSLSGGYHGWVVAKDNSKEQQDKQEQITKIINNLSQTEVNTIIKNHINDIDFNEYCKGDNACATLSDSFGNEVMKGGYDVDLINEKNCVVENNLIVSCEYAKTVQDDDTDDSTNDKDDEKGQGEFIECSNSPFHQKLCDFIDWYQDDTIKTDKDTKIDIKDISQDVKLDKDRVKFTASCPLDETHNISYGGVGIPITISYQQLCDGMSRLKLFIIGLSGLTSAMIIMGRR